MREGMFVKVIAASRHPEESVNPLITIHARYPRFIHAELMTHRCFSRNARSSRAVPVQRLINEAEANPVIPWHWGKNQPGMQAFEECNEKVVYEVTTEFGNCVKTSSRESAWRDARDYAVPPLNGTISLS